MGRLSGLFYLVENEMVNGWLLSVHCGFSGSFVATLQHSTNCGAQGAIVQGRVKRGGWLANSCKRVRTNLETEDEPQQIVAQGLLSCLQYPVP